MKNPRRAVPSRKQILALTVFTVLAVALAVMLLGEKKLKIAIHQNVEGVALKQIIAKFAKQKNFSVEVVELPYDQLYDAELEDVKGDVDHGFDVIMLDDPWMPAMLGIEKKGDPANLRPLDVSTERSGDFVESTLSVVHGPTFSGVTDNKFYALPFVGNSQLFMHRIGDGKAYSDWDSVVNDGYIMRVGAGNQIVTDFVPMVWAKSKNAFRDNAIQFPEESLSAFQLLLRLAGNGLGNLSIISQDDFDLAIQLQKQKASSSIIWSAWAMAMARLPAPQRAEFFDNFEFGDMPGGQTLLGAWLLAIPEKSSHAKEAREFIEFATSEEQIYEAARAGNPPPLKRILTFKLPLDDKDPIKKKEKELAAAAFQQQFSYPFGRQLESLGRALPRPRTIYWKKIETAVGDCLSRLYESAISPEEAREGANAAMDAILKGVPPPNSACRPVAAHPD